MLFKLLRNLVRPATRAALPAHRETPPSDPAPAAADEVELARAALEQGNLAAARLHLEQAQRAGESSIASTVLLAAVLAQQGELAAAEQALAPLLGRKPGAADAHNALGNIRRMQGRLDDAITHYDAALEAHPDFAAALSNRALCHHESGRAEAALRDYQQAIAIDPGDVTAAANLASLEYDLGLDADASARLERLLRIAPQFPQAHWVLGFALLRKGDFARGWSEYEWRERDAGRTNPSPPLPEWRGEPHRDGPLLVCAEQGLGDQIMFASCLDDLTRLADNCVVECDPRLVRLFQRSFPGLRVYPHLKKATEPWLADGVVPTAKTWLGSLPLRFRPGLEAFPDRRGYLVADPRQADAWRARLAALGPGLKVGISWRGGTPSTRRSSRSIPLVEWLPLLQRAGAQFVDLQYGDNGAEIEALVRQHDVRLTRWPEALSADYDATAALVDALDLVISVQTSLVHLAGALGKEVWVLVPRVPEWRYGSEGHTLPWYPSARLLRQTSPDWTQVIAEADAALRARTDHLRHSAGTYL
jgi:tetratricopeptide (TPR) repeat protein